ncbi:MAG: hypothetical protein O7F11_01775, partial [Acidobacteria bacterium]|nr:hypothetical protein [Acidobacteriota bacterium]
MTPPTRSALLAAVVLPALLTFSGCQGPSDTPSPAPPQAAATTFNDEEIARAGEAIRADELKARIAALSDDKMEGRLPGTAGEELAVTYIRETYRELGLE